MELLPAFLGFSVGRSPILQSLQIYYQINIKLGLRLVPPFVFCYVISNPIFHLFKLSTVFLTPIPPLRLSLQESFTSLK